jgi:multidrug efflux pump subunit AcrB
MARAKKKVAKSVKKTAKKSVTAGKALANKFSKSYDQLVNSVDKATAKQLGVTKAKAKTIRQAAVAGASIGFVAGELVGYDMATEHIAAGLGVTEDSIDYVADFGAFLM